ncbi:unnamed protein product [Rotaria sp. Silwood2]|nr:unnamed protein product [Rotaria sp. Silwood2]CAF2490771.1 unnamed protein product [Rotaria sp. Silwood2]CAF2720967.1 unnamed protein product [Rotaria sp. Silwood2]CAF4356781.1 unnamed protein product [Rotaria sp. Silwood2]CAF4431808.1 unnamed protein product [Rotaria sp. Silwood2]
MSLFPNAKEITESFAVWSALRQFIFPRLEQQLSMSESTDSISSMDSRQNAIIVVGDGMTPRTAALCAYLTKGLWQCYSIDPMLQYDTYADMVFINRGGITTADHCREWKSIKGLRMARAKIQTVSVQCRKAIVVMMHAHVTLEDAIVAVDASEGIIGIVTCPCCKWAPFQQEWLGQPPHHKYTDLRLLSVKNEMNVWYFPQGYNNKSTLMSVNSTTSAMAEDKRLPTKQMTERNIWGIDMSITDNIFSNRDGVKQRAIELWPQIFSNGSEAFNTTEVNRLSNTIACNRTTDSNMTQSTIDDSETWPWASTSWSPKDILPLMKSLCYTSTSLPDVRDSLPVLPSWFAKSVLVVGTIAAMRRCKQTVFYELHTCTIPSEPLEDILRLACGTSPTSNTTMEKTHASADTFPILLKSADRMWTCVEYQRHLQAVASYDATIGRKTKDCNSQTHANDLTVPSNTDRVNVVLSLLSYERRTTAAKQPKLSTETNENIQTVETTSTLLQSKDSIKVKLFNYNPQPRQSLFPWAMNLRPGDILVAYCELGCNAKKGPQLCLVDGILLFDSMLHVICADRRILR